MVSKEVKDFVRLQLDFNLARQDFAAGMVLGKRVLDASVTTQGDGRGVITLPGFGAPKASLNRLNGFLERNGYVVNAHDGGTPKGVSIDQHIQTYVVDTLGPKIRDMADRTGQAVSLVGQSAGGLYAREFARRSPEYVDRVITLGSPTFHPDNLEHANAALAYIVRRTSGMDDQDMITGEPLLHWDAKQPALPYVAIYSPIDGAVSEIEAAIPVDITTQAQTGAPRENLAVYCSHFGMTMNPFVLIAVADRLGQDKANWRNFDPGAYLPNSISMLSSIVFPRNRPDISSPGSNGKAAGSAGKASRPDSPRRATPEGTAARMRVTATLRRDHENITRLLNAIESELSGHGRPDYQMIYDGLHYLNSYSDEYHHKREDLLFERILRRSRRVRSNVDILLIEHEELAQRAEQLLSDLASQGDLSGLRRNAALNKACRSYVDSLRNHLSFEEKRVFAVAVDDLRNRDWIAIDAGIEYVEDPLFSKRIRKRYFQLSQTLEDAAEVVSEEALFLNFLEFEAFLSGAQALGRGIGQLNDTVIETANSAWEHNSAALKKTLQSNSLKSFAQAQSNAISGNFNLLRQCMRNVTEVTKLTAREVTKPYRDQTSKFAEAVKSDWSPD